jgi:hypothetical protein
LKGDRTSIILTFFLVLALGSRDYVNLPFPMDDTLGRDVANPSSYSL